MLEKIVKLLQKLERENPCDDQEFAEFKMYADFSGRIKYDLPGKSRDFNNMEELKEILKSL